MADLCFELNMLFPFVDNDIEILITINQSVKRFDSVGEENRKFNSS